MACAYPSYNPNVRSALTGEMLPIPCCNCFNCRLDFQYQAIDRMYCAWKSHNVSAFVTFTYDDNHLIINDGFKNATLSKDDVHKYLDKIKHQLNIPFEYYLCGEYGDKFNRPHYHAVFFGLDYQLHKSFFENSWKKGSVKVLPCNAKAFRYVSKYITSSQGSNDSEYFDYGIIPPFRKMSRGLGLTQFKLHFNELCEYGYFFLDGRKIKPNRYYFNKLITMNKDFIVLYERLIQQKNLATSKEAYKLNLSQKLYNLRKTANLESQLASKALRTSSKLKM